MLHKKQSGFLVAQLLLAVMAIALVVMAAIFVHSRVLKHPEDSSALPSKQLSTLPDITYYQTHKSNQFIVDMSLVHTGFAFKGKRANLPHAGAHAQFGEEYKNWPKNGTAPEDYPPVYSPVDGYVMSVDDHFSDYSKNEVDLYRIQIAFAKSENKAWTLLYSLEPFVKEPSTGFYAKFIDVKVGQKVHKGDVIAHMYLTKESGGGSSEHIHFQLNREGDSGTYAPAIFDKSVVQAFHDQWDKFGVDAIRNDPNGPRIPVCMGYKLSADENPFGTGDVECLI